MIHTSALRSFAVALLCTGAFTAPGATAQCTATDNLTTLYAEDNGLDGAMFDIVALETITIECFDVNWAAGTTGAEIWYRTGTHVGYETDSTAWTFIGAATGIVTAGTDNPTSIPIDVDLSVPVGATYAFYISNLFTSDPNIEYTNGSTLGGVLASDPNLQVLEGTGSYQQFGTTFFSPRQFNGTVYYSVGGVGLSEQGGSGPSVFPSSTTDVLNISFGGSFGPIDLNVVDATGRAVLAQRINGSGTATLDVSPLNTGAYTLFLTGAASAVHRFVKQ